MALIGRVVMIMIGFALAIAAAGAILVVALVMPELRHFSSGVFENDPVDVLVGLGFVVALVFAVVPGLILIVLSEIFAIRSLLLHAVAGGALALGCYVRLVAVLGGNLQVNDISRHELEVMAAAGIAAGFVYWLITGRGAGNWRAAPPPRPSGALQPRQPEAAEPH